MKRVDLFVGFVIENGVFVQEVQGKWHLRWNF